MRNIFWQIQTRWQVYEGEEMSPYEVSIVALI